MVSGRGDDAELIIEDRRGASQKPLRSGGTSRKFLPSLARSYKMVTAFASGERVTSGKLIGRQMIELKQNVPGNVIAFKFIGQVTGDDYENVLIPAMEAALGKHNKVRALAQLGPDFTGFEAAAMWDDAKVGLKHYTSWEKIALVTDIEWVIQAVKIFGFLVPGEVKRFSNDQLAEALNWVTK
jgi:hypothetical protein